MRITRMNINRSGYYNPSTEAHKLRKDLHGGHYAISRADAYREKIDELFTDYAFPGGYPVIFVTDDSDVLCAECAKKMFLDERIDVTADCYYEGPTMFCDHCNMEIESAYGDPDEEES